MKQQTKITGLVLLLLLLLLTACAGRGGRPEGVVETGAEAEAETADVSGEAEEVVEEVAEEPVVQPAVTILADGAIKLGRPTLPLSFETSGKLLMLNVSVGDTVSEGDVIATLDDKALLESLTSAELRVTQAENSLLQSQNDLDKLLDWEPDASTVAIAEANITSAQTSLQSARNQDAVAGNGLTSVQINIDQANRELIAAQEQYDNAFSEGRLWEQDYDAPVCEVIGGLESCSPITYATRLKNDREIATTRLQNAQEQLRIAQSNLAVERSRISNSSSVSAEASLVSAEQELVRAMKAPTAEEVATAQLAVTQAELTLEQERFSWQQAQDALDQSTLLAPWAGTILSVDVAIGGTVGAGSPIVTLVDTEHLEFHTTNLSERDLEQIEIGQEALVTLKTYGEPFSGTVTRIDLQADGVVGDAAVFPVVIVLDTGSDDRVVRVGMTGRAEIIRE